MSAVRAGQALLGRESFATPRAALWTLGTVGLEASARALGRYDVVRGSRSHAVWEMCDTTKQHIDDAANAQRQHNVAVFHIVNFQRLEVEIGPHASRQISRRVADRIQQALGSAATVSAQEGGTAVALLPGDRGAAERAAAAVVQLFEATPVTHNGRGSSTPITLACGIIAFPQSGPLLSTAVPAPRHALEPASSATS
jgi:GGDEF domain-containing protein